MLIFSNRICEYLTVGFVTPAGKMRVGDVWLRSYFCCPVGGHDISWPGANLMFLWKIKNKNNLQAPRTALNRARINHEQSQPLGRRAWIIQFGGNWQKGIELTKSWLISSLLWFLLMISYLWCLFTSCKLKIPFILSYQHRRYQELVRPNHASARKPQATCNTAVCNTIPVSIKGGLLWNWISRYSTLVYLLLDFAAPWNDVSENGLLKTLL
jgi:hypothetical protein